MAWRQSRSRRTPAKQSANDIAYRTDHCDRDQHSMGKRSREHAGLSNELHAFASPELRGIWSPCGLHLELVFTTLASTDVLDWTWCRSPRRDRGGNTT
jgi:hypothetical protein